MGLSVVTIARSRRLTHREYVKRQLGLSGSTEDLLLDDLIHEYSAAIESHCRRIFAREVVTETLAGYDDLYLQLSRTPLVSVPAVNFDGSPVTDFEVADRDEGTLYRRDGWGWTAQSEAGLTGWQRWPRGGQPLVRRVEPLYSVPSYVGGYVLPSLDVVAQTTISAAAGDSSFNDSANGFPGGAAGILAGDVVDVSGFATAANNGRFAITGNPAAGKITVAGTLADAAAGATVTIRFRGRADVRPLDDVEKACIEAVKSGYLQRKDDPQVVEKQVGQLRIRRGEAQTGGSIFSDYPGLPAVCVGLLRPWVREA
jgi:hypothetical protein